MKKPEHSAGSPQMLCVSGWQNRLSVQGCMVVCVLQQQVLSNIPKVFEFFLVLPSGAVKKHVL